MRTYPDSMAQIANLILLAVLNILLTDASECPKLRNLTVLSEIVTKHNEFAMTVNSSNRSNGTVISLQCNDNVTLTLDGPDVIICSNSTWNPPQPHCVPKPPPPIPNNPHLDVIIVGTLSGCVFLLMLVSIPEVVKRGKEWRSNRFKKSLLEEDSQERFYKVWTCGRSTKQFIKAKGLIGLKREASRTFRKASVARFVLEEDGTMIDTDGILDACRDQTLMALGEGELWWDRNINSEDGRLDAKRLTFEVCNQDRTKRKLILAADLRDLCRQGQLVFGYLPSSACLESDGTIIDNDVLFTFFNSTIMLLERGGAWSPSINALPDVDRVREHANTSDDMMFKVWSVDHSVKLVVFAKNLAELHIKAAKCHKVPNPVEIINLSTGASVTTDTHLKSLADRVLIIKSSRYSNDYRYIDDTDNATAVHKFQNDFRMGGHDNDYAKVQKMSKTKHGKAPDVLPTTKSSNDRRNGNGNFPNSFQGENWYVENSVLDRGTPRYTMLPEQPTSLSMLASNEHDQNNSRNVSNDQRFAANNNFGLLRDMTKKPQNKQEVKEMIPLKDSHRRQYDDHSEYSNQGRKYSDYTAKPMLVTGGAKQPNYSDVFF